MSTHTLTLVPKVEQPQSLGYSETQRTALAASAMPLKAFARGLSGDLTSSLETSAKAAARGGVNRDDWVALVEAVLGIQVAPAYACRVWKDQALHLVPVAAERMAPSLWTTSLGATGPMPRNEDTFPLDGAEVA